MSASVTKDHLPARRSVQMAIAGAEGRHRSPLVALPLPLVLLVRPVCSEGRESQAYCEADVSNRSESQSDQPGVGSREWISRMPPLNEVPLILPHFGCATRQLGGKPFGCVAQIPARWIVLEAIASPVPQSYLAK
jgi:hypothetical protein